jgi:spermidine synthase
MPLAISGFPALYALLHYGLGETPTYFFAAQFVVMFMVMLLPTILMGATFPTALKAFADSIDRVAEDGGKLYAVNTAGSVAGALSAGFLLVPALGLQSTNFVAVSLNILAAVILARSLRWSRALLAGYLGAIIFVLAFPTPTFFFNVYQAGRHASYEAYQEKMGEFDVVFERNDVEGQVHVLKRRDASIHSIFIRGRPEGTSAYDLDQHQLLMAYLPLAIRPDARSFLKIGLGPGATLRAAAEVPTLTRIDGVDLNGGVIEAVRTLLQPSLAADDRVRFIRSDARRYLQYTPVRYDVITAQSSDPTDDSSSYLFTVEYYQLVKSRLAEKGVFGQFVPTYLLEQRGTDIVIKAMAEVFPFVYGWELKGQIFVVASSRPIETPVGEILEQVDRYWPGLSSMSKFRADPEQIKSIAARPGLPLNTDDRPVVEFIAAANLAKWKRARVVATEAPH